MKQWYSSMLTLTYLHSPVHSCLKFSAVLENSIRTAHGYRGQAAATNFGTMSLKSSILILPAGVSPMLISMKTIGRVVEDMVMVGDQETCGN